MKLPQLQTMPKKKSQNEYQQTFYGLNLRRTAGPQEFADQANSRRWRPGGRGG